MIQYYICKKALVPPVVPSFLDVPKPSPKGCHAAKCFDNLNVKSVIVLRRVLVGTVVSLTLGFLVVD